MISTTLFRELETLRREMNSIFGGVTPEQDASVAFLPGIGTRRYPRVNLSEDTDNFYIDALIPGVEPDSLDINLTGRSLTLSGERLIEEPEGARWQRQERGRGKFMRALELPLDVESDKISAEYVDGMLRILLPKAETAKPKRISINPGH
jgi:HSP20 family protein